MCLEPATVHATVPVAAEGTNVDQFIAIGLQAKLRPALLYADRVARGELELPIAGVFAPDVTRDAHRQLELCHTRGKLVLRP